MELIDLDLPRGVAPTEACRSRAIAMLGALAVTMATSAGAETPEELARTKGCLSCHAVDQKVVGPAYKEVAAKYAGQADTESRLVVKVLKGSTGAWGFVPMPPNTGVSEEEAHVLVKWVLSNADKPAP
jgi:cytochrome c